MSFVRGYLVPVVKTLCFHCRGAQVQSLVAELRSYTPRPKIKGEKDELCSGVSYSAVGCEFNSNDSTLYIRYLSRETHTKHGYILIN